MDTIATEYSLIQYMRSPETQDLLTVGILGQSESRDIPDTLILAEDLGLRWKSKLLGDNFHLIASSLKQAFEERVLDSKEDLFEAAEKNLDERFHLSARLKVVSIATSEAVLKQLGDHLRGVAAVTKRWEQSGFAIDKLRLVHRFRGWVNESPFSARLKRHYIVRIPERTSAHDFSYGAIANGYGVLLDVHPLGDYDELAIGKFVETTVGRRDILSKWKSDVLYSVICGDALQSKEGRNQAEQLQAYNVGVIPHYELPKDSTEYRVLSEIPYDAPPA